MSEQVSLTTKKQGHRSLLILLFAGFVLTGVATVINGPMLPLFIQRWSLNDRQAGFFFTVQFTAALGGVGLLSALSALEGYRPALGLGYAFMGKGLSPLNGGGFAAGPTAGCPVGGRL